MILTQALAATATAYGILSLAEWYVHRHHLHRRGWMNRLQRTLSANHRRVHHPAYRRDFAAADPPDAADVGVPSGLASTLTLALPASATLALAWPVGGAVLLLAAAGHSVAWTAFHREMHRPRGRWFARTAWYRACRRHHERHHADPTRNFCGLCLGADRLLGTHA